MKTNPDPERDDALVDALLQDETWQAASAGFKTEALRTFHTRQRIRRLTRWAGSATALALMLGGVAHWLGPAPAPRQIAAARNETPTAAEKPQHLTDQDLVAAFPEGTCFIAEVDGQKELIFLDPEVERTHVAQIGAHSHSKPGRIPDGFRVRPAFAR